MSEESPSYSRVWGPIVHAMVQSGASGQEWAVLVALLRWQREGSNVLSMSVPTICKYTGLDEDTVRHRLSSLSKRYFVSAGGNEFPILEVIKPAGKGRTALYALCVGLYQKPLNRWPATTEPAVAAGHRLFTRKERGPYTASA